MQSGAIRGHQRCNLEPSHLHEHRLVRSPRHQPEDLDALRLSDAMRATHSGPSRVLRGTQRHSAVITYLPDAMRARHRLQVVLRIPIRVKENARVRGR
jgi:hypothetical protein